MNKFRVPNMEFIYIYIFSNINRSISTSTLPCNFLYLIFKVALLYMKTDGSYVLFIKQLDRDKKWQDSVYIYFMF